MSYVSLDDFKSYARSETASADDGDLQQALDVADLMVNKMCARVFTVAGTASARTFVPDPTAGGILRIPDATTVTGITENGTALAVGTDYLLEPVNTTQWSGEVWPYDQIRRQNTGYWYGYRGTGTVVVTATWGWAAVPAAVKLAAKVLAKDIMSYRDVKFGLVGVSDFGGVKARQASLVGEILAPYRRAESYGIA